MRICSVNWTTIPISIDIEIWILACIATSAAHLFCSEICIIYKAAIRGLYIIKLAILIISVLCIINSVSAIFSRRSIVKFTNSCWALILKISCINYQPQMRRICSMKKYRVHWAFCDLHCQNLSLINQSHLFQISYLFFKQHDMK